MVSKRAPQGMHITGNRITSSDMHEWYIKKYVNIGNPNQTRHLGDHHRRIGISKQGLHTLLILIKGAATALLVIWSTEGASCHLCVETSSEPGSRGKSLTRIITR